MKSIFSNLIAYDESNQDRVVEKFVNRHNVRYICTIFDTFNIVYVSATYLEKRKYFCIGAVLGSLFF